MERARQKESEEKRNLTQTVCPVSTALSISHSFTPSNSPPSSLINCVYSKIPVFWSSRSQHSQHPDTHKERETLSFSILSIPQHLLHLSFLSLIITFQSCWRRFTISAPPFLSVTMFTCCGTSLSFPLACLFSLTIPPSSSCGLSYLHSHLCLFIVMQSSFFHPSFPPAPLVFTLVILLSST